MKDFNLNQLAEILGVSEDKLKEIGVEENVINDINNLIDSKLKIHGEEVVNQYKIELKKQEQEKIAVELAREEELRLAKEAEEFEAKQRVLSLNDYGFLESESIYSDVSFKADVSEVKLDGLDVSNSITTIDITSNLKTDLSGLIPFSFENVILMKDNSVRTLGIAKDDRSALAYALYSKTVRNNVINLFTKRPDFVAHLFKEIFLAKNGKISIRSAITGYNWIEAAINATLDYYNSGKDLDFKSFIYDNTVDPCNLLTGATKKAMLLFIYHFMLDNNLLSEKLVLSQVVNLNELNLDDDMVKYGLEGKTVGVELTKLQMDNIVKEFQYPRLENDMTVVSLADSFLVAVRDLYNQFNTVTQIVNSYKIVLPLVRALLLDDYSSFDLTEITEIKNSTNLKLISSVLNIALDALGSSENIRPSAPSERWYAYIDLLYKVLFSDNSHFFKIISKHEYVSHFDITTLKDDLNFKKLVLVSAKYQDPRPINLYFQHSYGSYIKLEHFKDLDLLTNDISYFIKQLSELKNHSYILDLVKNFINTNCNEVIGKIDISDNQLKLLSYCLADKLYLSKNDSSLAFYIDQNKCKEVSAISGIQNGVFITDVTTALFLNSKEVKSKQTFPLARLPKLNLDSYLDGDSYQPYLKTGLFARKTVSMKYMNLSGDAMFTKQVDFTFGDSFLSHVSGRHVYLLSDNDINSVFKQSMNILTFYYNIGKNLLGADDSSFKQMARRYYVISTLRAILKLSNNLIVESMRIYNDHNAFMQINSEIQKIKAKQASGSKLSETEERKLKYLPHARSIQNEHRNKLMSKVVQTMLVASIFGFGDDNVERQYLAQLANFLKDNYSPDIVELIMK